MFVAAASTSSSLESQAGALGAMWNVALGVATKSSLQSIANGIF